MEKGDKREESEESMKDELDIQDPMTDQVQGADLHGSHSDQQLQKSGDLSQDGAPKLCSTPETQKLMQQEESAQKVGTRDSLQKSEEDESYRQEFKDELAEVEESEPRTDVNVLVQQNDESPFAPEQDSGQTHQKVAEAMHQESDEFSEGRLVQSDGNTAVQRTVETPESILILPLQESTQITHQDNDGVHQEDNGGVHQEDNGGVHQEDNGGVHESLRRKLEANLPDKLKEDALKEGFIALIEDLSRSPRHEANGRVRHECDRTAENDGNFQESGSDAVSEEFQGLQTRRPEQGRRRPLRTRQLRAHVIQLQTLAPIEEALDEPVVPFEVEIQVRRNWRRHLPTHMPNGMRDYMRRVRERHVPPERRALCEELERRCVRFFYSLLVCGILAVALYYLSNFLDNKYGTDSDSNSTTALPDLSVHSNIPVTVFKADASVTDSNLPGIAVGPGTYMTDLEASLSTTKVDLDVSTINPVVRLVLNDMNTNGTNPVNSLV